MTGTTRGEEAPQLLKEDPERLVLRGRPAPVIRFRRGAIVAVTGTMTAALIGLAWLALEPPSFRLAGGADEPEPASRAAADGVADAPATYADVPALGPPLPGDLGRPILEQQRMLEGRLNSVGGASGQADLEGRLLAGEASSARTSAVLVRLTAQASSAQIPAPAPDRGANSPAVEESPAVPAPGAGQQRKLEFAGSAPGDINPHVLAGAPSPWTLSAGTLIPASLITGINSDLPGLVLAQVTEPVRDSATGRAVLIPQGARLIGKYDSMVAFGQQRALIAWQRILFPDGSSVRLDNLPAADLAGYAGLEDKVDFHEWRLLKGIALSTLLGVGSELGLGSGDSDLVRAIERSVQRDGASAGDQIVARNLEVQPTLTIRPGWRLRALIHKDLVLRSWKD